MDRTPSCLPASTSCRQVELVTSSARRAGGGSSATTASLRGNGSSDSQQTFTMRLTHSTEPTWRAMSAGVRPTSWPPFAGIRGSAPASSRECTHAACACNAAIASGDTPSESVAETEAPAAMRPRAHLSRHGRLRNAALYVRWPPSCLGCDRQAGGDAHSPTAHGTHSARAPLALRQLPASRPRPPMTYRARGSIRRPSAAERAPKCAGRGGRKSAAATTCATRARVAKAATAAALSLCVAERTVWMDWIASQGRRLGCGGRARPAMVPRAARSPCARSSVTRKPRAEAGAANGPLTLRMSSANTWVENLVH